LFITDLFHPVDSFTVKLLLNGNMSHGSCCSCPMSMLFTRRVLNHIITYLEQDNNLVY